MEASKMHFRNVFRDFPGSLRIKSLSPSAGDVDLIPDPIGHLSPTCHRATKFMSHN